MEVRSQSFPTRCEICHQSDCFDGSLNQCERCEALKAQSQHESLAQRVEPHWFSLIFCRLGLHKWNYTHWERECQWCETVQHIWRIFGRNIEWRTATTYSSTFIADLTESLPLPIRAWGCVHCSRVVMRVHPPGNFEHCPSCGKDNFIDRK